MFPWELETQTLQKHSLPLELLARLWPFCRAVSRATDANLDCSLNCPLIKWSHLISPPACLQSLRTCICIVRAVTQLLCVYIQCIRKVFRPFDFFHILLCYSLGLHFFPSSINTQYPIMTKHFCKCIQYFWGNYHIYTSTLSLLSTCQRLLPWVFLGLMLQPWHTCIWGVSRILLCRSWALWSRFHQWSLCTLLR